MAFRVVLVENEMSIRIKLDNLIFDKEEGAVSIPITDISTLVIDNLKINISARTLCHLAENNIAVIFCNQEHLPIGLYSSYDNHSRMSKKIQFQIERDKAFYDNLWTMIILAKIKNQAQVLKLLGKSDDARNTLGDYMCGIRPGDPSNREAHAAKVYFNALMGTSFSRGNEDILMNSGLDYGYTIVRSYIARLCVGYGLNSQLGIHHRNEYNRFNLVDDLLEPVRPVIDIFVYRMLMDESFFTAEHRHRLINFVNHFIKYNGKTMHISSMLEQYVASVAAYIEGKEVAIIFPLVEDYRGEGDEI